MKTNWQKITVGLLLIVGGLGVVVAATRNPAKSQPSANATMSDPSMASVGEARMPVASTTNSMSPAMTDNSMTPGMDAAHPTSEQHMAVGPAM